MRHAANTCCLYRIRQMYVIHLCACACACRSSIMIPRVTRSLTRSFRLPLTRTFITSPITRHAAPATATSTNKSTHHEPEPFQHPTLQNVHATGNDSYIYIYIAAVLADLLKLMLIRIIITPMHAPTPTPTPTTPTATATPTPHSLIMIENIHISSEWW